VFERFTDKARQVLVFAQEEARLMRHNFLGTEHLLLGLLRMDTGVAGRVLVAEGLTVEDVREDIATIVGAGAGSGPSVLRIDDAEALASIGIDLDSIKAAVEDSFGAGALDRALRKKGKSLNAPPFVPRAKKVMELSLREALALKHNYIGTEHILLAIIREGEGVAAQILVSRLHSLDGLRTKVIEELERLRPGA
jgi:ATP-dependent Clp protease ATP-binding subunit ClpA